MIKSELVTACVPHTPPKPYYPRLKKSSISGTVILFTSHQTGVVVAAPESPAYVGSSKTDWAESSFVDYEGSVVLRNE